MTLLLKKYTDFNSTVIFALLHSVVAGVVHFLCYNCESLVSNVALLYLQQSCVMIHITYVSFMHIKNHHLARIQIAFTWLTGIER